jgi:XTP/dITP diphosphohydrolase
MDIYFATTNKHKIKEARLALRNSNVKIHALNAEKIEPENWAIEEIVRNNSKRIADENVKTVIVEDTGVFFEAFDDFPGNMPKRWFEKLGYEGLLGKFFEGDKEVKNRRAYFKTVIGYCEPGKKPLIFVGIMKGSIGKEVRGLDKDVMAYERIFICKDGRYLCDYSRKEKDEISHRAKAFRKLSKFLESSNKK